MQSPRSAKLLSIDARSSPNYLFVAANFNVVPANNSFDLSLWTTAVVDQDHFPFSHRPHCWLALDLRNRRVEDCDHRHDNQR
jgi:hypothetical protein